MSTATKEPQVEKAIAKSISFYPDTLFFRVEKFAAEQEPKRSTSAVVSEAVAEYLAKNAPVVDEQTAAALAQVEAAASKDATLAADILQFIRDRKRTRRSAGSR